MDKAVGRDQIPAEWIQNAAEDNKWFISSIIYSKIE